MKPEARMILVETHARTETHRQTPAPPAWQQWDLELWRDVQDHGPAYHPGDWFGRGMPEAHRVRFLRALRSLESGGLVVTWAKHGRLSHISLTPAGDIEAQRLLEVSAP